MAEVLRTFEVPIVDAGGEFEARVVGRLASDNMWEGWLEFIPIASADGEVLVSRLETTQPDRTQLVYWAGGLSQFYASGALARARRASTTVPVVEPPPDTPAPPSTTSAPHTHAVRPEAVLDPFEVGGRSLDILAQELTALGRARLLNIIDAYDLNPASTDISALTDAQLITFIVTAVDVQMNGRIR